MVTKEIKPDIIADIHFYTTEEGGREGPAFGDSYKPKFILEKEDSSNKSVDAYDCLLLISNLGKIFPGQDVKDVPIVFQWPEGVREKLNEGTSFWLKEGRYIAEGVVTKLCWEKILKE